MTSNITKQEPLDIVSNCSAGSVPERSKGRDLRSLA